MKVLDEDFLPLSVIKSFTLKVRIEPNVVIELMLPSGYFVVCIKGKV